MNESNRSIQIQFLQPGQWHGDVLIRPDLAPEKPAPGAPGMEVGDITLLHTPDHTGKIRQTVLVSLGSLKKINAEKIRRAGGFVARWIEKNKVTEAAVDLSGLAGSGVDHAVYFFAEGLELGAYRFDRYKSGEDRPTAKQVYFLSDDRSASTAGSLDALEPVTAAVNLAREWAHEPANVINPVSLAERAQALAAESGLKCTVIDDTQLARMGAGAILGVGKGSQTPSRMIVLEYPGQGEGGSERPIVLVGKAITFDTGGYSIKTTDGIQGMKYDKCGGLAVLATLRAASELKLKALLVGIVAAAENMISKDSYRPDDILTSLSGKTIEIISTDAEGRLVLSDALTYAQQNYQPRAIIDLATLTGGVVTALGHIRAGIMANDDELANRLIEAGEQTYERLWRLPLDEEYFDLIKGDEADIKNSGGREGAPIFGGIFLKQFVDDQIPWAHLDIAGVADTTKDLPYCPKGATGFGIRLLLNYLQSL